MTEAEFRHEQLAERFTFGPVSTSDMLDQARERAEEFLGVPCVAQLDRRAGVINVSPALHTFRP